VSNPLNRDQLRTAVKIGYRERRKRRIHPLLALVFHGVGFFLVAGALMAALVIIVEALRK